MDCVLRTYCHELEQSYGKLNGTYSSVAEHLSVLLQLLVRQKKVSRVIAARIRGAIDAYKRHCKIDDREVNATLRMLRPGECKIPTEFKMNSDEFPELTPPPLRLPGPATTTPPGTPGTAVICERPSSPPREAIATAQWFRDSTGTVHFGAAPSNTAIVAFGHVQNGTLVMCE